MKTIAIRLSLSLVGLIAITAPRATDAATLAAHLTRPAIHASATVPTADPSIVG